MQAWKYTMPAFVVPFFFVLDPLGTSVLLKVPKGSNWFEVSWVIAVGFISIAALAAGLQGWAFKKTNWLERTLLVAGGLLLVAPVSGFAIGPVSIHGDFIGAAMVVIALGLQFARKGALAPARA
jgi:TRAP-type uncharacterized transport system fused permease subunit